MDNLLEAGKISQSTYDSFDKQMDEAIVEIERQQKSLMEKMNSKAGEVEDHIKTLEKLLANFEIRHVTGEVAEDVYQREVELLSTGLETARGELDTIQEAVSQLSSNLPIQTAEEVTEVVETPQPETEEVEETPQVVEIEQTPEEVADQTLPEPPVESEEGREAETWQDSQAQQEASPETGQETEGVEEKAQETEGETEQREEDTEERTEEGTQETWQNVEDEQETSDSQEEETQSMGTVVTGE